MPPLIPMVTKEMTQGFAKAWDLNGIKVILDSTTVQFATDWANIALKSFVADVNKQAQAIKAEKAKAANITLPPEPVAPPPVKKSSIILTD